MINFIGAYIVTLFLAAIVFKRPSMRAAEAVFVRAPLWQHLAGGLYLGALALHEASDLLNIGVLYYPNYLLSGLTLWIHEAGHVYWGWDGEFLHSLGGTLNEIIFPLLPALYCCCKKFWRCSALFCYWLGYNCFGIADYISDARTQALPLLGGGTHDWNLMLGKLGLLPYDSLIGIVVFVIGCIFVISSLAAILYLASPLGSGSGQAA